MYFLGHLRIFGKMTNLYYKLCTTILILCLVPIHLFGQWDPPPSVPQVPYWEFPMPNPGKNNLDALLIYHYDEAYRLDSTNRSSIASAKGRTFIIQEELPPVLLVEFDDEGLGGDPLWCH